jgi:hypothetical protein
LPKRFSLGTKQSLKITSEVSLAHAQLVFFFARAKTRVALLHDKRGNSFCSFWLVGHGHGHANVRVVAVGDEGFRAVENPAAVLAHRGSSRAAGVRARLRLGQRPAAEFFALRQRRDIFLALLRSAKFIDVIGAQRIVRRNDQPDRAVDARELLDDRRVLDVAKAGAAAVLRKNHAHQAHFREFRNQLGRKLRGLVPFHDVRGDFRCGKFAHAAPELLLFVGERKVHKSSSKLRLEQRLFPLYHRHAASFFARVGRGSEDARVKWHRLQPVGVGPRKVAPACHQNPQAEACAT